MRVLPLYIVVNDVHWYQLKEQEPLIVEESELPLKLVAKNGFHFSKPFYIKKYVNDHILIGIGCQADNGRLWGGVALSVLFFILFFATGYTIILLPANLPLLYLVFKFFFNPAEFITLETLKP